MNKELKATVAGILLTILMAILFFSALIFFTSCDSTKEKYEQENDFWMIWDKTIQIDGSKTVDSYLTFSYIFPPKYNDTKTWRFVMGENETVRTSDTVTYRPRKAGTLKVYVTGTGQTGELNNYTQITIYEK